MKIFIPLIAGILFFSLSSCETSGNKERDKKLAKKEYIPSVIVPDTVIYITLNDSTRQMIQKMGKKLAYATGFELKKALKLAIKAGGPAYAVSFCNTRAMEITDSISVLNGAEIRRITPKNRNPLNAMDENEQNLFKGYVMDYIGGAPPKPSVSWNDTGNPVYYLPIMVDPVCLNCHGTPGKEITPDVANKIKELYPDDLATGYSQGDPRGLWAITFPQYRITKIDQ